MDLNQALQNIRHISDSPPAEEIMCIRKNKAEAIPLLIDFVTEVIKTCKDLTEWEEGIEDPVIALFLLAEFGSTEAFHLFAEILEIEDGKNDWLIGDTLTEDMGGMTASVASEGDIVRIKAIVENREINVFQRLTAVNVLIGLYARGIYQRSDLVDFLAHLLDNYNDGNEFVDCLADKCHDVAVTELYPRIRKLFADGDVVELFIDASEFAENAPLRSDDDVISSLQKMSCYGVVTDTLSAISEWACYREDYDYDFDEEDIDDDEIWMPPGLNYMDRTPISNTPIINEPKIGRNAPCPCGSGQKYKRCCGGK